MRNLVFSRRQNPESTAVQQPLLRLVLLAAFSVNVLKTRFFRPLLRSTTLATRLLALATIRAGRLAATCSVACCLVLLAAGLPGCVWISDDEVTAQLAELTDSDGDGFQDEAYGGEDCDDGDSNVHPGAEELCDGADNDCDGDTDEDLLLPWYGDGDGDGFGDEASMELACDPSGDLVDNEDDCDDGDAAVHPGAEEICDEIDNDCDGDTDEADATDAATWYLDSDGDQYGDVTDFSMACTQPSGFVDNADDCDDTAEEVNPGAEEICDEIDNDCDDDIDEADAVDAATWYADVDTDGYGDTESTTLACSEPSGYVAEADPADCDDEDASIYPGALEQLDDGQDSDCDGEEDGFSFVLHDTRSGVALEGPRLALGAGQVYLAWATEELDDGGAIYDGFGLSIFDGDDLSAGETEFWSTGSSKESQGVLGRFDLVANDDFVVAGRSFINLSTRWIQLDGLRSSTMSSGSMSFEQEWALSFDQLQVGLSELGNVTAVGCGLGGAGIHAVQIAASSVASGAGLPAADALATDPSDDHDVCEYDHSYYNFYMGDSSAQRLDYYEFDFGSNEIGSYSSSGVPWVLADLEITTANGFLAAAIIDLVGGSNSFYIDIEDLSGTADGYHWGSTTRPLQAVDVSASPAGVPYACAVDDNGAALLLWSDLLGGVTPVLEGIDLEPADLGTIDDCAIAVSETSVALIALRSGDDIALGLLQVP